ncbi:hypothetical protein ACFQ0B_28390 [Nonomuraea thailandensis]
MSLAWFDGGHDGGNGEADWLFDQSAAWFARYLKGEGSGQAAPPVSAFTVTRDGGRDPGTRQRIRLHPEAASYPGLAGTGTTTVALNGPEQNIVNPPGGALRRSRPCRASAGCWAARTPAGSRSTCRARAPRSSPARSARRCSSPAAPPSRSR